MTSHLEKNSFRRKQDDKKSVLTQTIVIRFDQSAVHNNFQVSEYFQSLLFLSRNELLATIYCENFTKEVNYNECDSFPAI